MAAIHDNLLPEDAAPEVRRWTLEEFIRLDELGFFPEDSHWELLDGQLYKKMGQNEPHIRSLRLTSFALRVAFGSGFDTNCQIPLHLQGAAPEPDITVLRGTAPELAKRTITEKDVGLVVEIADTRLDTAHGVKLALYAQLKIPEYWIVDLRSRVLEVRRGPRGGSGVWTETRIYAEDDFVIPLFAERPVSVADLLPPP